MVPQGLPRAGGDYRQSLRNNPKAAALLAMLEAAVVHDDVDMRMRAVGVQRRHIGPFILHMGA